MDEECFWHRLWRPTLCWINTVKATRAVLVNTVTHIIWSRRMVNNWLHWHKTKKGVAGKVPSFATRGRLFFSRFSRLFVVWRWRWGLLCSSGVSAYTCTHTPHLLARVRGKQYIHSVSPEHIRQQDYYRTHWLSVAYLTCPRKLKKKRGWWRICDCVLTYLAHQHTAGIHIHTAANSMKIKRWRGPGKEDSFNMRNIASDSLKADTLTSSVNI